MLNNHNQTSVQMQSNYEPIVTFRLNEIIQH